MQLPGILEERSLRLSYKEPSSAGLATASSASTGGGWMLESTAKQSAGKIPVRPLWRYSPRCAPTKFRTALRFALNMAEFKKSHRGCRTPTSRRRLGDIPWHESPDSPSPKRCAQLLTNRPPFVLHRGYARAGVRLAVEHGRNRKQPLLPVRVPCSCREFVVPLP